MTRGLRVLAWLVLGGLAVPALPAQKEAEFWAAYAEALKDPVGGFAKKKALVTKNKTLIPLAINYQLLSIAASLMADNPKEAAERVKILEDVARMYQLLHRDRVLWRRVEFAKKLDKESARILDEAFKSWDALRQRDARQEKTPQTVEQTLLDARNLIDRLESIEEDYLLGDVAFLAGRYCLLKEDYEEAAKFFAKAKRAFGRHKRTEWENHAALQLQKLEREHGVGVGRGAKPRRERKPRRTPKKFPPVKTTYKKDRGPWRFPSPDPANSYDHMLWRGLTLSRGKPVTWPLGDGSVIVWEGGTKLFLDLDNSGKKRRRLKAAGGTQTVADLPVRYARTRGKYRVLLRGLGEEKFLGYGLRFGGQYFSLRMARACHREGTFQGVKFSLIDDNLNAKYDDYGTDLIQIGNAPPQPLSRVLLFQDRLYVVTRVKPDGSEVVFEEYVAETGRLRVQWQGGRRVRPAFLVFQLVRGEFPNTFVNAAGGEAVPVPVGYYRFVHGIVTRGERRRLQFVRLGTGKAETFPVDEGETAEIRMGAPFDAVASVRRSGDPGKLVVPGPSIKIYGAHGEEYRYFYPDSFSPTVTVRIRGGHTVVRKRLGRPADDVLNRDKKLGVQRAWYPVDLTFKGSADRTYELKIELRHPLLGVVKGPWHTVAVETGGNP